MSEDDEYLRRYADADRAEDRAYDLGNRTSGDVSATYKRPTFVDAWRCKTCGTPVAVDDGATHALAKSNALLERRGELPLATNEVIECDNCRRRSREKHEAGTRQRADELAAAMRSLRQQDDPAAERTIRAEYPAREAGKIIEACRAERASSITRRGAGV